MEGYGEGIESGSSVLVTYGFWALDIDFLGVGRS